MSRDKTVQLETAGADQSTIVHIEDGDSEQDVLEKAFEDLDGVSDSGQFQLRKGAGQTLSDQSNLYNEVSDGEVLHATTQMELG